MEQKPAIGSSGIFNDVKKQSIVEDNLQSVKPVALHRQFQLFLKDLASGTIFLSGSNGSTPPNHLVSNSSEYRMLIQESEKEYKI